MFNPFARRFDMSRGFDWAMLRGVAEDAFEGAILSMATVLVLSGTFAMCL
jgi:hypothetical protein